MKPEFQIEGLKELRRDLKNLRDKELDKQLKLANEIIAKEIVARALPNVPSRTGRLRASVKGIGRLTGAVGKAGSPSRVPYATVIHWGRKFGNVGSPPGNHRGANPVRARPFLTEAAAGIEQNIADRYMAEIDKVLDAVRAR